MSESPKNLIATIDISAYYWPDVFALFLTWRAFLCQIVLDCTVAITFAGREHLHLRRQDFSALPLEAQVIVVAARILQAGGVALREPADIVVLNQVVVLVA